MAKRMLPSLVSAMMVSFLLSYARFRRVLHHASLSLRLHLHLTRVHLENFIAWYYLRPACRDAQSDKLAHRIISATVSNDSNAHIIDISEALLYVLEKLHRENVDRVTVRALNSIAQCGAEYDELEITMFDQNNDIIVERMSFIE